ncbi:DUF58 domain-containing protein, partial [Micromonospora sp. NPDC000207]|uniref:DUF58 domain-containing protein n=1 Tax=Micromonospora sp. NPDC000207 TaxID=3154246 RepID=UPI00331C119B
MGVTARGAGLLAVGVGFLAAGFWFGYPELTVLGAVAALAVGYALVTAVWRPRLAVSRRADPDRVARGDPASMVLTVRNAGRLRSTSLVAEDRCGGRTVAVPLLRLRPGRDTQVRYDVPTLRRGVVPVGPLRVTRRDPLGLVELARPYGGTVPVWVHPRIHRLSATPTGVGRSLDGRVDAVPHGSITFDSLREYVVGDELRRVHWRTSARVGELMVRENVDTSLPRLVVVVDNREAAHPGVVDGVVESFESVCEAAASVVSAAFHADLPVTLLLVAPQASGLPDPSPDAGTDPSGSHGIDPSGSGGTNPSGSGGTDLSRTDGTDPSGSGGSDQGVAASGPLDRLAAVRLDGGDG